MSTISVSVIKAVGKLYLNLVCTARVHVKHLGVNSYSSVNRRAAVWDINRSCRGPRGLSRAAKRRCALVLLCAAKVIDHAVVGKSGRIVSIDILGFTWIVARAWYSIRFGGCIWKGIICSVGSRALVCCTGVMCTARRAYLGIVYKRWQYLWWLHSGQIWTITTDDITTGNSTSEQLNTSVNFSNVDVVLESYNLPTQCSYLSGNAYFTNLSLDSGFTTPSWLTGNNGLWCNMNPVKVSSSEVDLHTQSWKTPMELKLADSLPSQFFYVLS